jgi:hypothetical protein
MYATSYLLLLLQAGDVILSCQLNFCRQAASRTTHLMNHATTVDTCLVCLLFDASSKLEYIASMELQLPITWPSNSD